MGTDDRNDQRKGRRGNRGTEGDFKEETLKL